MALIWAADYLSSMIFGNVTASFDPLRCASLHNDIISHVTECAVQNHNNSLIRNFFNAYGSEAEAVRGRLSRPLIQFLENIDVLVGGHGSCFEAANFLPFALMPAPSCFWHNFGGFGDHMKPDLHKNWLILYLSNQEGFGLYLDMDTNLVVWHEELMGWPDQWYSLERILEFWLKMYKLGKFRPSYGEDPYPWQSKAFGHYVTSDLDRNLQAYDDLLVAIQQRRSDLVIGEPGLVDEATLDEFQITGFYRDFLLKARRPSFEYIAPGIRVPNSDWLRETFTQDHGSPRWNLVRDEELVARDPQNMPTWMRFETQPLPLFPGPVVQQWHDHWPNRHWISKSRTYLFGNITGLYLWPETIFADAVRFPLPFALGHNGYTCWRNERCESQPKPPFLRYEDGLHSANPMDVWHIDNDVLYRGSSCPFMPAHETRLFQVLDSWATLVRIGYWGVGKNGVSGNIDEFKKADTALDAHLFRLQPCFESGI